MAKICHAHCPDDSGAILAVVVAVVTAVLTVIAAQVIESLFVLIVVTGSVLIAAGIGLFGYLVHRDWPRSPVNAARARPCIPARLAADRSGDLSAAALRDRGA